MLNKSIQNSEGSICRVQMKMPHSGTHFSKCAQIGTKIFPNSTAITSGDKQFPSPFQSWERNWRLFSFLWIIKSTLLQQYFRMCQLESNWPEMCIHHRKIPQRDKVRHDNNTGKYKNMAGISAHTKSSVHANDFFYSTKL
jgi:hypothetical protein